MEGNGREDLAGGGATRRRDLGNASARAACLTQTSMDCDPTDFSPIPAARSCALAAAGARAFRDRTGAAGSDTPYVASRNPILTSAERFSERRRLPLKHS